MFEKVNPKHPDKVADRIAGALVDFAYKNIKDPKVAVEVLIGHDACTVVIESSFTYKDKDVKAIVSRIAGDIKVECIIVPQDEHLAKNQSNSFRCGDNGIFKGTPITNEQKDLTHIAKSIYDKYSYDGKYIYDILDDKLIICQSNASKNDLQLDFPTASINPLGDWTGGINVDSGATNRKLGSDMGDSVTGGGLHGKDLSKADVSVNIVAWLLAQKYNTEVIACCAIGDESIVFRAGDKDNLEMNYTEVVETAREYINKIGGFEKFAEWGLIR